MSRVTGACGLVCLLLMLSACAEPPEKEMNQAQGAIDAARAAGADRYAVEQLAAAQQALQQAGAAVAQNDYRLALSLAIDSRDRAQNAAKSAVDARAKARGDVERTLAEANMLVTRARERLAAPDVVRLPRRTLDASSKALDDANRMMQEARAAVAADDYARALQLAAEASAHVQRADAAIDKATTAVPARRRR